MKIQSHHAFALLALLVITMSPTGNGQVPESLKKIEDQYVAAFQLHVEEGHQSKVGELNAKYLVALERAFQAASKGDRLEEALAVKEEIKRVQEKQSLPEKDDGSQQAMAKLRTAYRGQIAKLMAERGKAAAPIVRKFDEALAALQSDLTKSGRVEEAAEVKAYRDTGVASKLLGETTVASSSASSPEKPIGRRDPVLAAATKEKPFVNTLGMKFVPVKDTDVLVCIHETRWKDFAEFATANPSIGTTWKNQTHRGYSLTERAEEHPVVYVSWEDATAFCRWLSGREEKTYRLPTDQEWSMAVGLGSKEKWRKGDTPQTISKDQEEFPWGKGWPPPKGAGNFSDQSRKSKAPDPSSQYLEGYDDGFPTTAPAMSFASNLFGLYDMEGNVGEWVDDWWNEAKTERVVRGGSWSAYERSTLLSSCRRRDVPESRRGLNNGFRIVVVTVSFESRQQDLPSHRSIIENSSWRTPTGTLFVFEPDGKGTRSFAGADQTAFTWRQRSGGVVEVNGEGSQGGKMITWFFRFVNQQEAYYGNSKENISTALQRQP